jgi:hypothetical protein
MCGAMGNVRGYETSPRCTKVGRNSVTSAHRVSGVSAAGMRR